MYNVAILGGKHNEKIQVFGLGFFIGAFMRGNQGAVLVQQRLGYAIF